MKTSSDYTIGQQVEVAPAYDGSGRYREDGWRGHLVVVGRCGDDNLKLSRFKDDPDWEVIMHLSRIVGSGRCAWAGEV